jgi:hypothetical protein
VPDRATLVLLEPDHRHVRAVGRVPEGGESLRAGVEAREVTEVGDDEVELGEPVGVAPADLLRQVAPLGQVRLELVDAAGGLLAVVDHADAG